jgi:Protein of unknown function (DUF3025)
LRFIAPARAGLDARLFDQPIFDALEADRDFLLSPQWPTLDRLDHRLDSLRHGITGQPIRLVAMDEAGEENYEARIFRSGRIATRADNWHDLFNALVWARFPRIKSALNHAQVRDMAAVGSLQRTRRQAALTQFDEAGAIVVLRDASLLDAWDRHDWLELFLHQRAAWADGRVRLHVFGHALFEHALNRAMLLVGKCIVLVAADGSRAGSIDQQVAVAIESRQSLLDPQDLRPLPLAGIPGWHHDLQDADFYRQQPCFRPLRPGRVYPPPSSG